MRRADHMKPLCAASDTEPRLVQMLHTRARRRKRLYMPGCRTQARRSPAAHRPQRRRRHTRPEQNLQHLTQPALRKKLRMTQPNRQRRKTGPILNRTRHPLRKRPPRHSSATSAAAGMAAMLRNLQRTRLRKVEYLARNRRPLTSRSQKRPTAAPAYLRNVIHRTVRDRRPAQRMTLVTRLAPRLAARPTAKAPRPTLRARLLQPVARRRLTAVPAVQTQTALQRRYPVPKPRVLQLKTHQLLLRSLHTRPRENTARRTGTTHGQVDSSFDKPVNPRSNKTSWAVTTKHDISHGVPQLRPHIVMPGLVPGIHFRRRDGPAGDARNESGHDGGRARRERRARRLASRAGNQAREPRRRKHAPAPARKCAR